MKALVCFHDDSPHPFKRFLKPGFRHCMVAVQSGNHWIEIDRLVTGLLIRVKVPASYDLAYHYRHNCKYKVVEMETLVPEYHQFNFLTGNFLVSNCVGVTKVVLGLKGLAFTPYSLYKQLMYNEDLKSKKGT